MIYRYFDFYLDPSSISIDIIDFLLDNCSEYGFIKKKNIYWGNYHHLFIFNMAFGDNIVLLFNFQPLHSHVTAKMIHQFLDCFQHDVDLINDTI